MARRLTDEQFTELVHTVWPGLYRTAYLILGDHQLAEDLTQTALAKTYASWRHVEDAAAAPAYARVVLANTAASWFRRRSWRNEHPTEDLPDTGFHHDPSTRTAIVDALATLAPRQRAVVVLRYYDDLSVRETAHALGISEGTVKSQTSDALARLRVQLDETEIPAAPAREVVAAGHALRRRRTAGMVATAVAVALVAVGLTVLAQRSGDDLIEPAEQRAYLQRGAWAVGEEVHVGRQVVHVPDLSSLSYTSLGALAFVVHRGKDLASTRSESILIRPDGRQQTLDLPGLEDLFRPPATDPDSPYVAYARVTAEKGRIQLVVADLRSGRSREVGDPLRYPSTRYPFRLAGNSIVAVDGDEQVLVDRRTGGQTPLDPSGVVTATGHAGGRYVTSDLASGHWQVHRTEDGAVLLDVKARAHVDDENATLSPDGRFLAVPMGESGIRVYSVGTGSSVVLDGDRDVSDYGWTPDGHLLGKVYPQAASEVETCDPETGTCTGTGDTVKNALVLVRGADSLPL